MAQNTDKFFELIERTFSVEEITPEKVMDAFYSGKTGKIKDGKDRKGKQRFTKSQATGDGQSIFRGLAERLAEGREINEQIKQEDEVVGLQNLRNQAKGLEIHSKIVTQRADDKIKDISQELAKITEERKVERLAEEKLVGQLENEQNKIDKAVSIITLDRIDRRLSILDKQGVDVSDAQSNLEGKRASIEEQEEEVNPDF